MSEDGATFQRKNANFGFVACIVARDDRSEMCSLIVANEGLSLGSFYEEK